jgi:histidine triad (HIT) family protein
MCIFCQIVEGKVPSENLYDDDDVLAFRDINPQAPVHIIIIPKKHIASIAEITPQDEALMSKIVRVANELAEKEGISQGGYRLVTNCREQGGQLVGHLHFHLLGGRQLSGRLG